jgi:hypothetical protein
LDYRALIARSAAVCAAWIMVASACSSSSSDSDDGDSAALQDRAKAKDFYVKRVHPATSACIGCHAGASGPPFMATDPQASYAALERAAGLIAAPKTSPLVQYVHKDTTVVIGPEERSIITQWLSLEATARNLSGAVAKPKTITDAYQQFADCMNFAVWDYYRMQDLAFTQTDSEGPCFGCHSTGQGSAFLSADSRGTFDNSHKFPYIQKLVVGKLEDNGSFDSLQPSNRFIEKANEICPPDSKACHPRYGLPPNVTNSVRGFVETTLQNLAAGTCSSGIVVSPDAGPKDAGDGG